MKWTDHEREMIALDRLRCARFAKRIEMIDGGWPRWFIPLVLWWRAHINGGAK